MKEWINPFVVQENSLKTSLENIKRIGFSLQPQTPKLEKEMRKWRTRGVATTISTVVTVSHLPEMGESLILNEN